MAHGSNWRKSITDEILRIFHPTTHAVTVVTETARLVEDGMVFHVQRLTSSLADAASAYLHIKTGTLPIDLIDIVASISRSGVTLGLYEDPTTTADGTTVGTPVNLNRTSSNTSIAAVYHTPTVTADGTKLSEIYLPDAGLNTDRIYGLKLNNNKWILKASSSYLIKITNSAGAANDIDININFVENSYSN